MSSQMPQTGSWSSPPTPHMGTQAPELELSARVSCDICWWVHIQPSPLWWSCPSSSAYWWETSGLLHPRNGWKCWPLPHGMGCSMHQATRSWWWWMARSTSNATLASCAKISVPGLGQISVEILLLVHDNATPHTARNAHNFLAGEEVEIMQWPARRSKPHGTDLGPDGAVYQRYDNPPTTLARLREALLQAGGAVTLERIKVFVRSMPRRLRAVMAA